MHGHFAGSNCPNFLGCNTVCGDDFDAQLVQDKEIFQSMPRCIRAILLNGPVKQAKKFDIWLENWIDDVDIPAQFFCILPGLTNECCL